MKYVREYLKEHQSKLTEAKKRIDEFILRTPIKSIFVNRPNEWQTN